MKAIHYINCFFYLITIIPYVSIVFFIIGMYAQMALGVVQLLLAMIILIVINKQERGIKKHIGIYWIAALANLLIIFLLHETDLIDKDIIPLFLFFTPMIIASYFVYITYELQKAPQPTSSIESKLPN